MADIPQDFYSFETNAPFERCIECDKYLLDEDTEYLIEKAVRGYKDYSAKDVIFDYAICMDCAEKLRKEISKESWQAMMGYFQQNMDMEQRMKMVHQPIAENLSRCLLKQSPIENSEEYQVYAQCKGKKLNMENPPYAICGEAMEEIIHLLSDKTIDEMNGFFNKHFAPDPSIFEPTPKLILV